MLWFDFGLKEGDTFHSEGLGNGGIDRVMKITQVKDTIFNYGDRVKRKCFYLDSIYMVEGIGSMSRGIGEMMIGATGNDSQLQCCHENNELLYQNKFFNDCFINNGEVYNPVDYIVLSGCLNNEQNRSTRSLKDRNEVFLCKYDYMEKVLSITHKDVLVNCANRAIDVKVKILADTITIYEAEVKEKEEMDCVCLKDLSYRIKIPNSKTFILAIQSDVSSQSYQSYVLKLKGEDESFQVTGKSEYTYRPFIMDGTCEWFTVEWFEDYYKHTISAEDTLILEKTYKKLFYEECKKAGKKYVGAIREDNKRVYYFPQGNEYQEEKLLYDFNMKIGDKVSYDHMYKNLTFEVAHIDTVLINNEFRRQYYFYEKYGDGQIGISLWDSWIEGIGSTMELMRPFAERPTCIGCHLRVLCVHQGDKVLYKGMDDDPCICDEGQGLENRPIDLSFRILKNPLENKLLSIELKEATFSKIDVYSWDGKLLLSKDISINNGILDIPLNVQSGNYIFILSRPNQSRESAKIIVL